MSEHAHVLTEIADRIDRDEDFAMRVGEDARSALESEGLPDQVIGQVLGHAEAEVVGYAMPAQVVEGTVARIAAAARAVAADQS